MESTAAIVRIQLEPGGVMPSKAYPGDAAYDVYTLDPVTVRSGGPAAKVSLGFRMELPEGYEAQIRPRSGLPLKEGLLSVLGTIDSGYRGVVQATVYKIYGDTVTFPAGTRIAQMVIQKLPPVFLVQANALTESVRGDRGHGSSGT